MASQCYVAGRPDAAVRYSEAGQTVVDNSGDEVRYGIHGWLAGGYTFTGQPERAVEWCRAQLARGLDTHAFTRGALVLALAITGAHEEATTAAAGLIDAAETSHNPCALSYALLACGFALRDAHPDSALDTHRRGLVVAQESGNRWAETSLSGSLCRLEARYGNPLTALDHFAVAIRNYHDSGNSTVIHVPLAYLAAFLDLRGRHKPAAVIAGFVLGDQTYESLAQEAQTMTTAAMAAYAYDQIDQARTELE